MGFLRRLQYVLGLQIFHSPLVRARIGVQSGLQRRRVGIHPRPRVNVGVVLPDGVQQLQSISLDTVLRDPPTPRTISATTSSALCSPACPRPLSEALTSPAADHYEPRPDLPGEAQYLIRSPSLDEVGWSGSYPWSNRRAGSGPAPSRVVSPSRNNCIILLRGTGGYPKCTRFGPFWQASQS